MIRSFHVFYEEMLRPKRPVTKHIQEDYEHSRNEWVKYCEKTIFSILFHMTTVSLELFIMLSDH